MKININLIFPTGSAKNHQSTVFSSGLDQMVQISGRGAIPILRNLVVHSPNPRYLYCGL